MGRTPNNTLKPEEMELYEYIITYKKTFQGNSPSLRDMSEHVRAPLSSVYYWLEKLERLGLVRLVGREERSNLKIILEGATFTFKRPDKLDTLNPQQMSFL